MAPQFNDVAISGDGDAAMGYSIPDCFRVTARTLIDPKNTITMKYRYIGGTDAEIAFQRRWMFALRISN